MVTAGSRRRRYIVREAIAAARVGADGWDGRDAAGTKGAGGRG